MSKPTKLGQGLIKALREQVSNRMNPSVFRPIKRIDLVFSKGGLGDTIARLPAVKYILDTSTHVQKVRVFLQDFCVDYATYVLSSYADRVEFIPYSKMLELIDTDPAPVGMTTDSTHHTTLHSHLTDHAFHTLVDEQPVDLRAYDYVQVPTHVTSGWEHLTNYVVITCGFTSPAREWPSKEINKVVRALVAEGVLPVFMGKTESVFWGNASTKNQFREDLQFELGLNLIDSTSLLEASQIMSKARAVIGLDNGLLHLAAAADKHVPIIAAYTTVRPEHRLPYRLGQKGAGVSIIRPKGSSCKFCQSEARFVHEHDFRTCYFNDYECIKHITGEQFIEKLQQIGVLNG